MYLSICCPPDVRVTRHFTKLILYTLPCTYCWGLLRGIDCWQHPEAWTIVHHSAHHSHSTEPVVMSREEAKKGCPFTHMGGLPRQALFSISCHAGICSECIIRICLVLNAPQSLPLCDVTPNVRETKIMGSDFVINLVLLYRLCSVEVQPPGSLAPNMLLSNYCCPPPLFLPRMCSLCFLRSHHALFSPVPFSVGLTALLSNVRCVQTF